MFEKRFFVNGLAHASYLFGMDGEAAVIDPKRDVEDYLEAAHSAGLKIVAIFETHPHADFVSGHLELAHRTGAKVYLSHRARASYERMSVRDGDSIRIGSLEVIALETPGHSPDSVSFLVREQGRATRVFTGDTLFVGDVGRPDLRDADEKPSVLAEALYESLQDRLLKLPGDVQVWPTHGAGSLCGRSISEAASSTIAHELRTNWAAQIKDRTDFVARMLANLPDRPAYFAHNVARNLRGVSPLSDLPHPNPFSESDLAGHVAQGGVIIDTRPTPVFGSGHFPGSIHITLDLALFSTWVGFFVPLEQPIVLVVDNSTRMRQARLELARIGYDHVVGFIEGGRVSKIGQITQLSAADLKDACRHGNPPFILDVRTQTEWDDFHIEGATHLPLPKLLTRIGELPSAAPLTLICRAGDRSSLAASLLRIHGFRYLQNVMGGMDVYRQA